MILGHYYDYYDQYWYHNKDYQLCDMMLIVVLNSSQGDVLSVLGHEL